MAGPADSIMSRFGHLRRERSCEESPLRHWFSAAATLGPAAHPLSPLDPEPPEPPQLQAPPPPDPLHPRVRVGPLPG